MAHRADRSPEISGSPGLAPIRLSRRERERAAHTLKTVILAPFRRFKLLRRKVAFSIPGSVLDDPRQSGYVQPMDCAMVHREGRSGLFQKNTAFVNFSLCRIALFMCCFEVVGDVMHGVYVVIGWSPWHAGCAT